MALQVSDAASNAEEQIEHAGKAIGRSKHRRLVFKAIHTGKQRVKSVGFLAERTGLTRKQVLLAAKPLAAKHVVEQTKHNGDTSYRKNDFIHAHKRQVLSLAGNSKRLDALPTKRKVVVRMPSTITLSTSGANAHRITVDDIGSFRKAHRVKSAGYLPASVSEEQFKRGIQAILGEPGRFTDWGGEKNDLLSSRLRLQGRRRAVAFAFKGPGTKGSLTPKKMGKNGDQLTRLFQSTADVFIVQYWRDIDQSVMDLMQLLAIARSVKDGKRIWFGLIDGVDSKRIFEAYRPKFLLRSKPSRPTRA